MCLGLLNMVIALAARIGIVVSSLGWFWLWGRRLRASGTKLLSFRRLIVGSCLLGI